MGQVIIDGCPWILDMFPYALRLKPVALPWDIRHRPLKLWIIMWYRSVVLKGRPFFLPPSLIIYMDACSFFILCM